MIDFFINVIFTAIVAILFVAIDWIAHQVISPRKKFATIHRTMDKLVESKATKEKMKIEVQKLTLPQPYDMIWGSELAAIAFSIDLAILMSWYSNPALFPFFSRWNDLNTSRELAIWMIILLGQLILLMACITLKHLHINNKEDTGYEVQQNFRYVWLGRDRYSFLSNIIGFISLLSSFIIISDSL